MKSRDCENAAHPYEEFIKNPFFIWVHVGLYV